MINKLKKVLITIGCGARQNSNKMKTKIKTTLSIKATKEKKSKHTICLCDIIKGKWWDWDHLFTPNIKEYSKSSYRVYSTPLFLCVVSP